MELLQERRWIIALLLLGGLTLLVFAASLRGAVERNVYALRAKALVPNSEWMDATQVCKPLALPPVLTPRTCSVGEDCYLVGVLALRRMEWDNAQKLTLAGTDLLLVFLRGWSEYCSVSPATAIATWSKAADPIRHKFLAQAQAALLQGNAGPALREGTIAHAIRPSAESFLVVAGAQAALDQKDAALETYYQALDRRMTNAQTFGQVGELEYQRNKNDAARKHLAEAVQIEPQNWHYWQVYGSVLFRLEDWAGSETAFAHAAELSPEFGAAHGGVALTQLRQGKLAEGRQAVAATLRFTTSVKQQAGYLGEFAKLAARAGDLKWSAELYTRALGRTPSNEGFWNALVATYAKLGDCAKMESVYRAYLEQMNAQQKKAAPQPVCPA